MTSMTGAFAAVPAARFESHDAVLANGGAFAFSLNRSGIPAGARFALDLYDLDNAVHPEGHIGWKEYDLSALPLRVSGRLTIDSRSNLHADLEGLAPIDMWHNPDAPDPSRIALMAVLRTADGDLISVAQIPVLKSADDLAAFRSSFSRDYRHPRYAALPRPIPAGRRIHIVAPNIFAHDAVGNLCLGLFRMLKQHNADVHLFAANSDISFNDIVEDSSGLARTIGPDDVLAYFFSTYDDALPELAALKCHRKFCYFHGVTNPDLLTTFDLDLSDACSRALAQIPLLAGFDHLATNSAANVAALQRAFAQANATFSEPIRAVPPLILGDNEIPLAPPAAKKHTTPTTLLFVGRIVSHKRVEDLLSLLAQYRERDPSARGVIVGHAGQSAYRDHLRSVQAMLELPDDCVAWRGDVTVDELAKLYDTASVYVSMSEDEGFCLPIFEAMCRNLPVFAYDLPAVRETLGGAGMTFGEKNFGRLADQLHDLLLSPDTLHRMLLAQHRRARELIARMDGRYFLDLATEA